MAAVFAQIVLKDLTFINGDSFCSNCTHRFDVLPGDASDASVKLKVLAAGE
jgi:hypothetical protein